MDGPKSQPHGDILLPIFPTHEHHLHGLRPLGSGFVKLYLDRITLVWLSHMGRIIGLFLCHLSYVVLSKTTWTQNVAAATSPETKITLG